MKLMPGKYQFIYNVGNGDVRTYDIFNDGQIQERIAKTNDVRFITTNEALGKLDEMIVLARKNKEKYKNTSLYDKISKTRVDMLITVKRFMLEHPIGKDDVRWK